MSAAPRLLRITKLGEVSLVDDPDNARATIEIIKKKGVPCDDCTSAGACEKSGKCMADMMAKARSFTDIFATRRMWSELYIAANKARDAVDALQSAVGSIMDDPNITDKRAAML